MQQQEHEQAQDTRPPLPDSERPADVVTQHSMSVAGETIHYTATVGAVDVGTGEHAGRIFYIAYTRDDATESARPVTFAYNGGPGSASGYVHMGAWGPKRVEVHADNATPPAPYTIIDNPNTLLAETDLVFIDPIGTGYSHVLGATPSDAFFGVQVDVEAVGEVIRQYITYNERWNSPKFLAGESYGTTRSAFLVDYLQTRLGMDFNGVVLVSSILNFETVNANTGNDLPYPLYLPTYAATAWYYDRVNMARKPGSLASLLDEVRAFAVNEYAPALMKADSLPRAERERVVTKLSAYTGLDRDDLHRANLRVRPSWFRKQLLRDRGEVVGRYDSRYHGVDLDDVGDSAAYDPTTAAIDGAFTAAINEHLSRDLGVDKRRHYVTLSRTAIEQWRWRPDVAGYIKAHYIDAARNLRAAIIQNPYLRVFFVAGQHDLATPFHAAEYTIAHLDLPQSLRGHVELRLYPSGHMVYLRDTEQKALNDDIAAFMRRALAVPAGA